MLYPLPPWAWYFVAAALAEKCATNDDLQSSLCSASAACTIFTHICGGQEGFKPPSPQLRISYTQLPWCGGQEGSKLLSP